MRNILAIALGGLLLAGCAKPAPPAVQAPMAAQQSRAAPAEASRAEGNSQAAAALPRKLSAEHLPNPWQIHEKVISGGGPEGDAAFAELAALGVRTVISVDGAKPDVATARKYGLRYVHLPHGYDGIPEERAKELAKAVRDLPGPIYIHCHHGKHRSPSAAAVACVSAGLLDPSQAVGVLQAAGTSEKYRGLYESAREARKLEDALLDALDAEFPEVAELPPIAEAMVALERTFSHMKAVEAANWKTPSTHPDIDPPHEALLLREHFTELLRTDAVKQEPEEFQDYLNTSEEAAEELEDLLRGTLDAAAVEKAKAALGRVASDCASCHAEYRDVPRTGRTSKK